MKETIKIYHNPQCSKSRATLALLVENDVKPEIIYYLESPLDKDQLTSLLGKLGLGIRELLRKSEAEYEEFGLDDASLSEEIIFDIVLKHPNLIQRPIVTKGERALLGRPPENVLQLLGD
jgi:arsenate reductase